MNEQKNDLDSDSKELAERTVGQVAIKLNQKDLLDLTGLSESEVGELKMQHAKGIIDVQKKANEMGVDVQALDSALSSFTAQTERATQADAHATITHSQTSSLGRTEVVIGNTDRAASGKMTRSGRGEQDRTIIIVIVVAVVVIVAALILRG